MTLSAAMLASDLAYMINDLPGSVTWSGTAYACAADDLTVGKRDVEAGIFPENAVELHIQTSLFATTRPVAGNTVTYKSKTLRVVSVKTSLDDLMITLTCEELTA